MTLATLGAEPVGWPRPTDPAGPQVYPKRLVDNGFRFEHPEVGEAVEHAVQSLAALWPSPRGRRTALPAVCFCIGLMGSALLWF